MIKNKFIIGFLIVFLNGCVAGINPAPAPAEVSNSTTVLLQNTILEPTADSNVSVSKGVKAISKTVAASGITCDRYDINGTNVGSCTTDSSGLCQMGVACSVTDAILVCSNGMKSYDQVASLCADASLSKGLSKLTTVSPVAEVTKDNLFAVLMLENAIKNVDSTWTGWGEEVKGAAVNLDLHAAYLVGKELAEDVASGSDGVSYQLGFIQAIMSALIQADAESSVVTAVCLTTDWTTIETAVNYIAATYNDSKTADGYETACEVYNGYNQMFANQFVADTANTVLAAIKAGSLDPAVIAKPLASFNNLNGFTNSVGTSAGFSALLGMISSAIDDGSDGSEFIDNAAAFVGVLESFQGDFSFVTDDVLQAGYLIGVACSSETSAEAKACGQASANTLFVNGADNLDAFLGSESPSDAIETITGYWAVYQDTIEEALGGAITPQVYTAVKNAIANIVSGGQEDASSAEIAECVRNKKASANYNYSECYSLLGENGGVDIAPPAEEVTFAQCTDSLDNDDDGDTDCDDSECASEAFCQGPPEPDDEGGPVLCADNQDNDADGDIDCNDVGCAAVPACAAPADPEPEAGADACADSIDNDEDGDVDCNDTGCADVPACAAPADPGPEAETGMAACADTVDNDEDGLTDCDDDGCADAPGCAVPAGDTTPPTIISVAKNATLLDYLDLRLTGVAAQSAVVVEFSEPMDPTTISNISYSCGGIDVPFDSTNDGNIWTLTPTSDLTGYADCDIEIGETVTDTSGNGIEVPVEGAPTYSFKSQCSTDDTFVIDTLQFPGLSATGNENGNCWTYGFKTAASGGPGNKAGTYTVAAGAMHYDTSILAGNEDITGSNQHYIYKSFNAASFTATISLLSASSGDNKCMLRATTTPSTTIQIYSVGGAADGGGVSAECRVGKGATTYDDGQTDECAVVPTSDNPLYYRLSWDSGTSTVTGSYRYGNVGDFTVISTVPGITYSGTLKVGIACASKNTTTFTQDVGSFEMDITASGPNAPDGTSQY